MSSRYGDHGYTLLGEVTVQEWNRPHAVMPRDLWKQLVGEFGVPIIGRINDIHYEFTPEWGVPANTAVIPEIGLDGDARFLLQKQR